MCRDTQLIREKNDMRKKICTIAVCVMMILIIMPTGVSAETNDWTYDANNRTLTSADQNITLYNVRASNKHLCIEYNNEKSFKAIDLTGKINICSLLQSQII